MLGVVKSWHLGTSHPRQAGAPLPSCVMSVTGQGSSLKATLEPLRVLRFPADEEPHVTPFRGRWPIPGCGHRPSNMAEPSTCYTRNACAIGSQSSPNSARGLQVTHDDRPAHCDLASQRPHHGSSCALGRRGTERRRRGQVCGRPGTVSPIWHAIPRSSHSPASPLILANSSASPGAAGSRLAGDLLFSLASRLLEAFLSSLLLSPPDS
ncbi:hypothetical protein QBC34DRAFT_39556 [Podospora aff. communis PSN243]|uniref:Uncharacterized protein n=1 Tax=Podospora aff. communis PSN243 TaxID=3040156 RepID=A0AAV9GW02_9PEZI|nr:hypothetical protein QBC34DRAFT_39556 [Podospora aff. communis PSN243]